MKHLSVLHRTGLRALTCASIALLMALGATVASADQRRHRDDRYQAFGRVIDVRPVYREVAVREPHTQCRTIERGRRDHYRRDHDQRPQRGHRRDGHASIGGAVVGGLIGGSIGHRIARNERHHRRAAATLAGAVIGSAVGHEVTRGQRGHGRGHGRAPRHDRGHRRPVERCFQSTTTRYENRLSHYDVTYVYRGRTFHARRDRDPGSRIEIDISVRPSDR